MTRTNLSARSTAQPAGILLVLLALILYAWTLDNGLQPSELAGGDLITHQYAQVQARPGNAPGYPVYTMGGWLWFHAVRELVGGFSPHPNPIPILSSYSTLWALLAIWLLYRLGCHITRSRAWAAGNWPIAWLVAAFYAVTYFFWYYATTTEQYSSAIAQTLAIVYVYLLWRDAYAAPENAGAEASPDGPAAVEGSRRSVRLLVLLAFLCGLALAHMLTVAFIVPPLLAVILWQAPELLRRFRLLAAVLAAALLPLISYTYVYVRGAAHPEWWGAGDWPNAQAWFWSFLSTAQGRAELRWGFEPGRAFFGNGFPQLIWQELSIGLLIVGLLGIALLDRRLRALLFGTLAIYLVFNWMYRYGNWFQVILPAYPLILLGVVAAADRWQGWAGTRWPGRRLPARLAAWLPHLLLIAALLWRADASLPAADSRDRAGDTALHRAALLLDQPLPDHARLFAALDDALALQYLGAIWGLRPGLRVVSSDEANDWLAAGGAVLAPWQAVPTLRAELPAGLRTVVQSATPDWILLRSYDAGPWPPAPAPDVPVGREVLPGLLLVGYSVRAGPVGAPVAEQGEPPSLDVMLTWQRTGEAVDWPADVAISVRPTRQGEYVPAPDGSAIVQQDAPRPAHGLLALDGLPPDIPFMDGYRLSPPTDSASRIDGLHVVLYRVREGGFENVAELRLPLP